MAKNIVTVATILASLFGTSQKAISEKLTTEEFNAFSGEAQEVQTRLDAQADGNALVATDLLAANASLLTAQTDLATAVAATNTANTALANAVAAAIPMKAKADQWDAYKASLTGAVLEGDSANKPAVAVPLSRAETMQALKASHPRMMEGINV